MFFTKNKALENLHNLTQELIEEKSQLAIAKKALEEANEILKKKNEILNALAFHKDQDLYIKRDGSSWNVILNGKALKHVVAVELGDIKVGENPVVKICIPFDEVKISKD